MSQAVKNESISVFFPAYNDAETITGLVMDALAVLPALTDDYEVLVINDGSTDSTAHILEKLASRQPQVRAIHHDSNKGYGAALSSGFKNSRKDLIFYTDGDGQYDARELAILRPVMTPEIDIVNGYKIKRADVCSRRVLGALYNRLARLLFQLPIRDVDCDFRLIRRSAMEEIELGASSGAICVELVHKLHSNGSVFAEVPVHHYPRGSGRSQFFTPGRVARMAVDFFLLWLSLVPRRPDAIGKKRGRASPTEDAPRS